jgi:hypothetical protein
MLSVIFKLLLVFGLTFYAVREVDVPNEIVNVRELGLR